MDVNQAFVQYVNKVRRRVRHGSPFFLPIGEHTAQIRVEYEPWSQQFRFDVGLGRWGFVTTLHEETLITRDEHEVLVNVLESIQGRLNNLMNNHDEQENTHDDTVDAGIPRRVRRAQAPRPVQERDMEDVLRTSYNEILNTVRAPRDVFDQLAGYEPPRMQTTDPSAQATFRRNIDPSQQVTLALVTLMYKKLLLTTPEYEAIEKTIKNSGSLDELLFVIESINKGEF